MKFCDTISLQKVSQLQKYGIFMTGSLKWHESTFYGTKKKILWYVQYMWFPTSVIGFWTFYENYPRAKTSFTWAKTSFTRAKSSFTGAESSFTCAKSNFTCAKSSFTCAKIGFIYTQTTRAVQKVRSRIFHLFLSNTEINYQGEDVQEVCTTTL